VADDRRLIFMRKWLARARQADDPFDCFFAAWIALVVAAQRHRTNSGRSLEDDSDRSRVVDYFRSRRRQTLKLIQKHEAEMNALARRRGSRFGNPILDTGNRTLQNLFERLSRVYTAGESMADEDQIVALAELVNKVRNNVFHGVKVYDDRQDLEILALVNPILLDAVGSDEPAAG
jgi:hypothetical protein